jgi:hypothetical protein
MSRRGIEEHLNEYFKKKFRNMEESGYPVTEMYQIIARPMNVDMDSPEIQRLIIRITAIQMGGRVGRYVNLTQLFNPIFELCMYCREDKYLEVLNRLWSKGTIGMSIPDLERKISRGGTSPRVNGKIIKFDSLNYSFKQVEQKLDLIFFDVCIRNNIRVPFNIGDALKDLGKLDQD